MARSNVRVRPARLADVPSLATLTATFDLTRGTFSGRGLSDTSHEHICERLAEIVRGTIDGDGRTMLVALDEADTVVGLVVARPDEIGAIDLTPALHVTHLLVSPKHRRRGVGRALLGAMVHIADDGDFHHVVATVGSGSREANRYLARLGFAPLVVHRVTSTGNLRRALGMADGPDRIAVLRRAAQRRSPRTGSVLRPARRGA